MTNPTTAETLAKLEALDTADWIRNARTDADYERSWQDCLRRGECPACGATSAKEAETLCRPVGDSCVACDEHLWEKQSEREIDEAQPAAPAVVAKQEEGKGESHD